MRVALIVPAIVIILAALVNALSVLVTAVLGQTMTVQARSLPTGTSVADDEQVRESVFLVCRKECLRGRLSSKRLWGFLGVLSPSVPPFAVRTTM